MQLLYRIRHFAPTILQLSIIVLCTVAAQLINVFILPILSRIYSPADFGVLAVYSSIISILAEISGLRYHLAIPLPKLERYANALVWLSLILQIFVVILLTICLFFAGNILFIKLSIGEIIQYKYLLPLGLFIIGMYNVFTQWAIRKSLFYAIGYTKITQCITGALVKVILGVAGIHPLGLLMGAIFSQGGGVCTLCFAIVKRAQNIIPKRGDVYRVLYKYRKFPVYSTAFGLFNTLGSNIPQLFLSVYFGITITGLYSMAVLLLQIPAVFIGQALGQVFLQKASIAMHTGNLQHISLAAYTLLWQVGCFPILFISVFAPSIFSCVLGAQWINASLFTILLSPWIVAAFVFSPMSMLYSVQERLEKALITEISYFIIRLLGLYIGVKVHNPAVSILLFSLSGFLVLGYRLIDILKATGNNSRDILNPPLKGIIFSIMLIIIPWWLMNKNSPSSIIIVCCIIIILIYIYYTYSVLKQPIIFSFFNKCDEDNKDAKA